MAGRTLTIDCQLGARVRDARIERHLSEAALGALLGISLEHITRFENGDAHISSELLTDIAAILGKSVSFFFQHWLARSTPTTILANAGRQEPAVEPRALWQYDRARRLPSASSLRREREQEWELADGGVGYLQ